MTIYLRVRKPQPGLPWPPPDPLPDGLEEWPNTVKLRARDEQEQAVWDRACREFGDPTKDIGGPELPKVKR